MSRRLTDLFPGEPRRLAARDDDIRVVNVHPLLDAQGAGARLGVLTSRAGVLALNHLLELLLLTHRHTQTHTRGCQTVQTIQTDTDTHTGISDSTVQTQAHTRTGRARSVLCPQYPPASRQEGWVTAAL